MSYPTFGEIIREDPAVDRLLDRDARVEVLASGFQWAEGPVWIREGEYLLFSDIPRNSIFRWSADRGVELFMQPSGYTGVVPYGREPGSNGLTLDPAGRLVLCEHGDRRVSRLEKDGGKRTLADSFQGKRLNSPNDLVYDRRGALYFTDPPYGLPENAADPRKELDFQGIFRLAPDGELTLLHREMRRPNGLAFSPDERTLYVANSDPEQAVLLAFPVLPDGSLGASRLFTDFTPEAKAGLPGLPDGLKVDREGNLWATGPGGVYLLAPDGRRLGRIDTGQRTANCNWGEDGGTLFITADSYLCRIRTRTRGSGW